MADTQGDGAPPQQPPRRRNVVSRDRSGCFTCRRRHLRCDKATPECSNCQRLDLKCEGYGVKFAFRDQTFAVAQKSQGKVPARKRRRAPSVSKTPTASEQPTAGVLDGLDLSFLEPSPQAIPETIPVLSGPSMETQVIHPQRSDWAWHDWSQTHPPQGHGQLQVTTPMPPISAAAAMVHNPHMDRFTGLDFLIPDPVLYPSLSSPISGYSSPSYQGYQSPRDTEYFQGLLDNKVRGLATILPLRELIGDDYISAPHLYSAALALSALNCPDRTVGPVAPARSCSVATAKGHALRHYSAALRTLHGMFPNSTAESFRDSTADELLAWLLTRLLLANFDLCWGSLAAWRAHLRAAGRILSAWNSRIMSTRKGRQLAQAFARMALLVRMQSGDERSVTGLATMNPGVAHDLAGMVERSESPRDRLLVLIREVGRLELKFRYSPALEQKWSYKMEKLEKQLNNWQRRLPVSELPVDTGLGEPIKFLPLDNTMMTTTSTNTDTDAAAPAPAGGVLITPLTFPGSADPYTAAVSYAHFLCARMRTRTRYVEGVGRVCPPDSEATARHICRVAAGLSPASCAQADAFGHGMMPAVVGACRWTGNARLRTWIEGWLAGYETWGPREGIWNVSQTRRLLKFMEAEGARRRRTAKDWNVVAAKIQEEGDDGAVVDEDEQRVWDSTLNREQALLGCVNGNGEGEEPALAVKDESDGPFRIVVHSRSVAEGWTTEYHVVQ